MDEALLSYYNRELAYLRKLGAEFAATHPKIAGRLRLDRDTVEDPHVSRLIESFAFLTARIRHKLDDSFPELTEALMGVLYPDYHAPIPSVSIAQIRLIPERLETRIIPAGEQFYIPLEQLGNCVYRSCYDTIVYPLHITRAQFSSAPFHAPPPGQSTRAKAVLRIDLACESGTTLKEVAPASLRFFLNGQPQLTFRLYEQLLAHATAIVVSRHDDDPQPAVLAPCALKPRGLAAEDAVLPADGRSGSAHRLLIEHFAFPEKFLFVELGELATIWHDFDTQASVFIYFDQSHPELVHGVQASTLLLSCTPIVNLFQQRLEPIHARDISYENRLRPDASLARCGDIHTVLSLYAQDAGGHRIDIQPFYGSHRNASAQPRLYWHLRREISQWFNGRASRGLDSYLSLVDGSFQVTAPDSDWIIGGEVLCTNRDLPDHLPYGPDQPRIDFYEGGAGLRVRCVTPATATIQPALDDASRWQLITQLSLQHFSGPDGLQVLQETLRLFDFRQLPETRAIIEGVRGLACSATTARITRGGRASICHGTRIEVELDDQHFGGTGLYLFSAILSEFFAHYCAINTFVQLVVTVYQRPGTVIEWPPRCGKQHLI